MQQPWRNIEMITCIHGVKKLSCKRTTNRQQMDTVRAADNGALHSTHDALQFRTPKGRQPFERHPKKRNSCLRVKSWLEIC